MTLKRTQVVMIPTNEKGNTLIFRENRLMWQDKYSAKNDRKHHITKYFHLYFLSDDKIKGGDWIADKDGVYQFNNNSAKKFLSKGGYKKIIATTDSSLRTYNDSYDPRSKTGREFIYLPQPSDDFLKIFVEEYNKNNQIKFVDVEYEHSRPGDCGCRGMVHDSCAWVDDVYNIKVNSKNEISIRKIKDTWTRDEVIALIKEFDNSIRHVREAEISYRNKWIQENLI